MSLCYDVVKTICSYIPKYKLLDWINEDYLDSLSLSENYNAIDYLKQHPEKIYIDTLCSNKNPDVVQILEKYDCLYWISICKNPVAIHLIKNFYNICWSNVSLNSSHFAYFLLKNYPENIYWENICFNTNPDILSLLEDNPDEIKIWLSNNPTEKAINILEKYPEKINWSFLSSNPCAFSLLEKNKEKINWKRICRNTNPKIIKMIINRIEENPDIINDLDWNFLSENPTEGVIEILKTFPHKIVWKHLNLNTSNEAMEILEQNENKITENLSLNSCTKAISLLEKNINKIDWFNLSSNTNPRAIEILRKNVGNINWMIFSQNPSIFVPTYNKTADILLLKIKN